MAQFRRATLNTANVIGAHLLNFKPILTSFEKNCKGNPRPRWECASKTLSFSSACKNLGAQHFLGAEIWFPEKVNLGGFGYISRSPKFLDQS